MKKKTKLKEEKLQTVEEMHELQLANIERLEEETKRAKRMLALIEKHLL